jgi:hypothetical protein
MRRHHRRTDARVPHPADGVATYKEEPIMAVFNAAFPIVADKLELAKAFGRDAAGPRRAALDEFQNLRGVVRETWSVQETPDGVAFSVIWTETADIDKAMRAAAVDMSDFAVWFRERVKEINGIELAAGPPPPAPVVTLDWRAPDGF